MAWLLAVLSIIPIYFMLDRFLTAPHDTREPPVIPQSIPFIGHVLGMLRHGSSYYTKITYVHTYPFYLKRNILLLQCFQNTL